MNRSLVCLDDFRQVAVEVLSKNARDYYESGAESEETLRDNVDAFRRVKLRTRVLRDVSSVDISTKILGVNASMPIGIAPSAMQKLAHDEGELGTARAAGRAKVPMILSTYSTTRLEEVADAYRSGLGDAPSLPLWFQLYVWNDRSSSEQLVHRAEAAGFSALVVTVDTPVLGRRLRDQRNRFNLPSHLKLANFDDGSGVKSASMRAAEEKIDLIQGSMIRGVVGNTSDTSMHWERDIPWLRRITRMKIILKGLLTAEDAQLAVQWGVDGIIVSNHGGRQLDTVPSTLDCLPEIVRACKGTKVEVYMDGGVRKGTDVAKALAIGAKAVFLGRPVLWGLACGGEKGVTAMLSVLKDEFTVAVTLLGCRNLSELGSEHVRAAAWYPTNGGSKL